MSFVKIGAESSISKEITIEDHVKAATEAKADGDQKAVHSIIGNFHKNAQAESQE